MTCALKICGIVSREDLETCRALAVDAIGINLWSGSPRGLSLDAAARVLGDAPPGGPLRVGVMVDPEPDELRAAHRLGDRGQLRVLVAERRVGGDQLVELLAQLGRGQLAEPCLVELVDLRRRLRPEPRLVRR